MDSYETIPEVIHNVCLKNPDKDAIIEGDKRVTYRDLDVSIANCAKAFNAAGIQPGDRVGLWAPNSAEWIVIALGIQSVGAALVPINTRYKPGEAAYPLQKTKAKMLFTADGFMGIEGEAVVQIRQEGGPNIRIININGDEAKEGSFLLPLVSRK